MATRRLGKEIREIEALGESGEGGISASLVGEDTFNWSATITGSFLLLLCSSSLNRPKK